MHLAFAVLIVFTSVSHSDIINTRCDLCHCFHLIQPNQSTIYNKDSNDWLKLHQLDSICKEKIEESSWLLEIYSYEDQIFVEKLIEEQVPLRRTMIPPVVPLNLEVTFLENWTWVTGKQINQWKSIIFGKNMKSLNGSHFVFVKFTNVTIFFDQPPSSQTTYKAICDIKIDFCGQLSGSLLSRGYCFYLTEDYLDWHQSRDFCKNKNGDLVSFDDEEKIINFFFYFPSSLDKSVNYWIGLSNIKETWLRKTDPVVYANWGSVDLPSVNSSVELFHVNLERRRWLAIPPSTFDMKIVCMTDKKFENELTITDDTYREGIGHHLWFGIILTCVFIIMIVFCVLYIIERKRSHGDYYQDHHVIFDNSTNTDIEIPTLNVNPSASNSVEQNKY